VPAASHPRPLPLCRHARCAPQARPPADTDPACSLEVRPPQPPSSAANTAGPTAPQPVIDALLRKKLRRIGRWCTPGRAPGRVRGAPQWKAGEPAHRPHRVSWITCPLTESRLEAASSAVHEAGALHPHTRQHDSRAQSAGEKSWDAVRAALMTASSAHRGPAAVAVVTARPVHADIKPQHGSLPVSPP
jgi:hypothetical protein